MSISRREALGRSRTSVEAVGFGDAFGENFFANHHRARVDREERELPEGVWKYTDDTVMALGIHEMFARVGEVDADVLAEIFAERYRSEPWRGYGPNARRILDGIDHGGDWRELSSSSFGGEGSFGNGGAMRVPPVGAYYAPKAATVAEAAGRTARVTHDHEQGVAGAIAVASAAGAAWRTRTQSADRACEAIYASALEQTPAGAVRSGVAEAAEIGPAATAPELARRLGSGERVTAMDTVPFVIWCAAEFCDDLEEALWQTVSGRGDRDTTCAMVGGIVALRTGLEDLPEAWFERREALDWRYDTEAHNE